MRMEREGKKRKAFAIGCERNGKLNIKRVIKEATTPYFFEI